MDHLQFSGGARHFGLIAYSKELGMNMVSPVITVGENDTVHNVAKIMVDKHVSALPVVDHAGKLVGIVSEADLMHREEAGTERLAASRLSFISGKRMVAAEYVTTVDPNSLHGNSRLLQTRRQRDHLSSGRLGMTGIDRQRQIPRPRSRKGLERYRFVVEGLY